MSPSKFKVATAGLLIAMASVGGGIMVYRTMAGKLAKVNPAVKEGLPVSPSQHVPYSPATLVSENLPIPGNFSMSVLEQAVIFPRATKVQADLDAFRSSLRSLPEGVAVIANPPLEHQALVTVFQEVYAEGQKGTIQVKPGCGLSILTTGPLLSGTVRVGRMVCQSKRLEVEMNHGPFSPSYTPVPESKLWRPLVLVPLLLPAGSYQLEVTWRAVDNIRDGKPLPVAPLVQTCSFVAPEGMAESQALQVHGVDFQTLMDGRCPVPEAGRRRGLHFGLRVTNRSDKELLFEPAGVQLNVWDSLRTADGSPVRYRGGMDHIIVAKPVRVPSGSSHVFVVRGELRWFKDSGLQDVGWYKGGTGLALSGVIGSGDTFWYYDGLTAGKHRLCLEYHVLDRPEPVWTGRVRTQDVEFEIVP